MNYRELVNKLASEFEVTEFKDQFKRHYCLVDGRYGFYRISTSTDPYNTVVSIEDDINIVQFINPRLKVYETHVLVEDNSGHKFLLHN